MFDEKPSHFSLDNWNESSFFIKAQRITVSYFYAFRALRGHLREKNYEAFFLISREFFPIQLLFYRPNTFPTRFDFSK